MSFFLVLVYAYSVGPLQFKSLGLLSLFGPGYLNSRILLPILIPLTFFWIHLSGESALFSRTGLIKINTIIIELLLLLILFPMFSDEILTILDYVPQTRVIGGRLNVPYLTFGLTVPAFVGMLFFSRKNFYSNYLSLLFWVMLTAGLSFSSGVSWRSNGLPLHHSLFFTGTGLLMLLKVLNLAWGKAYRDQLTQIPGRMALDERLVRLSGVYAICMIDIDNFKDFNDTYGHDAGDKVLKKVARLIQNRTTGQAYRFGGEEFTVLYPGQKIEDVSEELENLRSAIESNKVKVTRKSKRATKLLERKVTISLGLADSTGNYENAEEVLNASDNALFDAKEKGRNQLITKD